MDAMILKSPSGTPGWFSWLSIRLQLRSVILQFMSSSPVSDSLLSAQSLLQILSLPLSLSLPICSLSLSLSLSQKEKKSF